MKINKSIPEEYKGIMKEEMTLQELEKFGNILIKQKIQVWKNKWYAFWHKKSR